MHEAVANNPDIKFVIEDLGEDVASNIDKYEEEEEDYGEEYDEEYDEEEEERDQVNKNESFRVEVELAKGVK